MEGETRKENNVLRWILPLTLFFIAYAHYEMLLDYTGYPLIDEANRYMYAVGRFGVPIFFLVSGYFLYSKDGHSENNLKKKALHILYVIILVKVSLLVVYLIAFAFGKVSMDEVVTSFVFYDLTTSIVWFVYALFLIYVFFWILHIKKVDFSKTYFLVPLILAVDFLFSNILPLLGVTGELVGGLTSMNIGDILYPFLSMPFFILGYYIHRNKDKIDSFFSNTVLIWLIVLGVIVSFVEAYFILPCNRMPNILIGSFMILAGLFIGSFRVPDNLLRIRPLEFFGRKVLPFYFSFFTTPSFVLTKCIDLSGTSPWLYYLGGGLITVVSGILLALVVYFFFEKSWLLGVVTRDRKFFRNAHADLFRFCLAFFHLQIL